MVDPTARIAVLTYKRPADIESVLPQLVEQAERAKSAGWDTDILVVDNDAAESARSIVEEISEGSSARMLYTCEPEPGITPARNRALDLSGDKDILIFIDDDERPTADWLAGLLRTHEKYAACVVGPVVSQFDQELDPWIMAGGFFTRRRMPTGTTVEVAGTGNLLLDMRLINARGLRFDVEFGLSGGSDTLFTRQMTLARIPMVWCDEAVVYDVVPAARATRRWVLLRALRYGTSWSATSRKVARSASERLRFQVRDFGQGVVRIAGGLLRFLAGVVTRDQGRRARGLRNVARGIGLAAGVFGYRYHEYRRPASS